MTRAGKLGRRPPASSGQEGNLKIILAALTELPRGICSARVSGRTMKGCRIPVGSSRLAALGGWMAEHSRKMHRSGRAEPVPENGDPATRVQLETTSPRAVFGDLIAQALRALGSSPSPSAIGYLIDLLELQIRAPTVHAPDEVGTPTLAEALLTAISEGGCAQPSRLRDLGDRALFVSGFFGESLGSSEVGLEYYGDVGRTAYGRLSNQLCRSADNDGLRTLFEELADEFGSFVELLAEVEQTITEKDLETVLDLVNGPGSPAVTNDNLDAVILYTKEGVIKPKSSGQKTFYQKSFQNDILFAIGPAGTGKTFLAVAMAVAALRDKLVNRIVLTRPAVEAGENLGFLPGDFKEKIDPYLRPLYDALNDMIPADKLKRYLESRVIEIVPLAYMRGRTLNNAFAILDEAQNTSFNQMKMFLTRLGLNSKAIITGDITQIDLPDSGSSGLVQVQSILSDIEGIEIVYLTERDVVRHRLVRDIIKAYEVYETNNNKNSNT